MSQKIMENQQKDFLFFHKKSIEMIERIEIEYGTSRCNHGKYIRLENP